MRCMLIPILLLGFALSGCSTATQSTTQIQNKIPNQIQAQKAFEIMKNNINPSITWPSMQWVMLNKVPEYYNRFLPIYSNIKLNSEPFSNPSSYNVNDWHIPSRWKPYLYKNVKGAESKVLCITLQGTVFLKPGLAGRDWEPIAMADIPNDAQILAECVPLKPAVEAGIVPVYHCEALYDIPFPEPWQKATGTKQMN